MSEWQKLKKGDRYRGKVQRGREKGKRKKGDRSREKVLKEKKERKREKKNKDILLEIQKDIEMRRLWHGNVNAMRKREI